MIKKILLITNILLLLISCQIGHAYPYHDDGDGIFTIAPGKKKTRGPVAVTLCLQGIHKISCHRRHIHTTISWLNTTIPGSTYASAGIKLDTPGYTFAYPGIDCTPNANGYCIFPVNDTQPHRIALAPDDSFYKQSLYVVNSNNTVARCQHDSTAGADAGALSCSPTSVSGLNSPYGITVNHASKYAYITNDGNNTVSLCAIDFNTGDLNCSQTTGGGFNSPQDVVINPAGNVAYVSSHKSHSLSICKINAKSGAFNCSDSLNNFIVPAGIAIDPSGTHLYAVNNATNAISLCNINSDGSLSCSDMTGNGLSIPVAIAINPAGTIAYVTNSGNDTVSLCPIDAKTGQLNCTKTTGSGFNEIRRITIDPSGSYAYITNLGNNTISICNIDANSGDLNCNAVASDQLGNPQGIALSNP